MNIQPGTASYKNTLVATDFSPHAEAAVKQAIWLARQNGAKITLIHTLPDMRQAVSSASYQARVNLLYADGSVFQQEIRHTSETRMRQLIETLNGGDLDIQFETLLGVPYSQITHAVQKSEFDLVLAGTRGLATWQQFFIGSTASRLIRSCPSSVWIAKSEHVGPPRSVLAATDFSDVSRRAVIEGLSIARLASAEFHLLHIIDSADVPDDLISQTPEGHSLRHEINESAKQHLDQFVESLGINHGEVHKHLSFGTPWQEVSRLSKHLSIDLIAIGTIGRGGVPGIFLGNTAEKVLTSCDCSILTVKPADFVSPIPPEIGLPAPASNGTQP